MSYFSLDVDVNAIAKNFTVSLTPKSGDPDLYITCRAHGLPTVFNYIWVSRYSGAESVTVLGSDANFCVGAFVIGVYGFVEDADFVLEATLETGKVSTWLIDSVPAHGSVERGQSVYYQTQIPPGSPVDFSLTPYNGDPDLFVACRPFPTAATAVWSSVTTGVDSFRVNATDPNRCASNRYYITVLGFQHALYALSATTANGGATELTNHEKETGVVYTNQYSDFSFSTPLGTHATVDIVLTTEQDPRFDADLYISCTPQPTKDNYIWKSAGTTGPDSVVIHYSDPDSCAHNGGTFYIAVFGFRYSVFSIEAYSAAPSLRR